MKKIFLQKKGITLVETLFSLAIFSIVLVGLIRFEITVFLFNNNSQSQLKSTQNSRSVLNPIAEELRTMSVSVEGSYPIESASTNSLVFFSDINGAGYSRKVRYFLSGSDLMRGVIEPNLTTKKYTNTETISTLVRDVKNDQVPIFEYFPATYAGTTTPLSYPISTNNIRLVKISIILQDQNGKNAKSTTFSTQVSLRNLKDNL